MAYMAHGHWSLKIQIQVMQHPRRDCGLRVNVCCAFPSTLIDFNKTNCDELILTNLTRPRHSVNNAMNARHNPNAAPLTTTAHTTSALNSCTAFCMYCFYLSLCIGTRQEQRANFYQLNRNKYK